MLMVMFSPLGRCWYCPGGEFLSHSEDTGVLLLVRGDVHSYQTKSWLEILTRDKRATGRHQALRRRTDSLGGFCKDGTGPLELPGLSVILQLFISSYVDFFMDRQKPAWSFDCQTITRKTREERHSYLFLAIQYQDQVRSRVVSWTLVISTSVLSLGCAL